MNESTDSIDVSAAPHSLSWNCFAFAGGKAATHTTMTPPPRPVTFQLNSLGTCDMTANYTRIPDCGPLASATQPGVPNVRPGDAIAVCGKNGAEPDVDFRILHIESNSYAFMGRFDTIAACTGS